MIHDEPIAFGQLLRRQRRAEIRVTLFVRAQHRSSQRFIDSTTRRPAHAAVNQPWPSFFPVAAKNAFGLTVAHPHDLGRLRDATLSFDYHPHDLCPSDVLFTHRYSRVTHCHQGTEGDISIEFLWGHYHRASTYYVY